MSSSRAVQGGTPFEDIWCGLHSAEWKRALSPYFKSGVLRIISRRRLKEPFGLLSRSAPLARLIDATRQWITSPPARALSCLCKLVRGGRATTQPAVSRALSAQTARRWLPNRSPRFLAWQILLSTANVALMVE